MNNKLTIFSVCLIFVAGISYAQSVDLPQTGQVASYAAGDDGDIQAGVAWPLPRFTDNGDGTITDDLTGLVWLKDANCFDLRTWSQALIDAVGLADGACGLSDGSAAGDWRVPNINEMKSLFDAAQADPATWLTGLGFTNVQADNYESSTTYAAFTDSAWNVDMSNGSSNGVRKDTVSNYFLFVRGASSGPAGIWRTGQLTSYASDDDGDIRAGAIWPVPRFTDNGDGTVTDELTSLVWLKDAGCLGEVNWAGALSGANGLANSACGLTDGSVAGDWRLPNLRELQSVFDFEVRDPALPSAHPFTNLQLDFYWSSTSFGGNTDNAWYLQVRFGNEFHGAKVFALWAWAVRDGGAGGGGTQIDLPRTGQTTCYDGSANAVPCAGTGQDGDILAGIAWPSPRFTDNGDGTVTDHLTGLTWLQDGNCFSTRSWADALSDANGLASGACGLTDGSAAGDWRLPNVNEYESLVNAEEAEQAAWLNGQGFVRVQSFESYWSSTTSAQRDQDAQLVSLFRGGLNTADKSFSRWVWAVRGTSTGPAQIWKTGQTVAKSPGDDGDVGAGAAWPAIRFSDNGDGTVTDHLTGLIWLKDANCFGNNTFGNALAAAGGLADGACGLTDGSAAGDWYLPNRKQLYSLMDHSQTAPSLPAGHPFLNVDNGSYWTSTTYIGNVTSGWQITTWDSNLLISSWTDQEPVWPVRSGAPVPNITVTDAVAPTDDLSVPFGDVTENTTADQAVTVTNAGSADLTLGDVGVADALLAPFSVLNDNCSGQVLTPAASCTFDLRFAPTTTGVYNDSLDIPSDDPDENPVTVDVSGTGVPTPVPDITVTDSVAPNDNLSVPFGDVTENTTADQTVTVKNDGSADLTLGSVAVADPLAAPFSVLNDNCSGQVLTPAASCTFDVRFAPTISGAANDTFDIPSDDPDPAESPVTLDVSGNGTPPVPDITVTDASPPADDLMASFGDVTENTTADQTVTVTNDGAGNLVLGNVAMSNPLAAPFSVLNDNCSGQVLTPAANCTFDVRFAPTGTGAANDSLDIPSNDPDPAESPVTFNVNGTGTPTPVPDITVSDTLAPNDDLMLPFGAVTVGSNSGHAVTVANAGNDDLSLGDVAVANPLAAPFSVLNDNCSGQTLAPAVSCTFDVRFAPTGTGAVNDSLDIPSDDPDESTVTVSVSGTGAAVPVPDITVTDSLAPADDLRLPFADLTVGGQTEQTVSVANDGAANLALGIIAMADPLAEPFSIVGNTCTGPALSPTDNCAITIRFAPVAAGNFNDSFDIPSDDPDESTVTIAVSGTGLAGVNNPPSSPRLVSPANGQPNVATTVIFEWRPSIDPDGDPVTYDAYNCTDSDPLVSCVPVEVTMLDDGTADIAYVRYAGLGFGGGAGLFGLILLGGLCARRRIPLMTMLVVVSATLLGSCLHDDDDDDGANFVSYTISGLDSRTTYYWVVVAKDGNGGETQSEVWTYTTL